MACNRSGWRSRRHGCERLLTSTYRSPARNGLGIAASLASGLRQNFGSLTKPFHAGAAAQHGVIAALLAKNGYTSNSASLEGKAGFFHNFTNGKKNIESLELWIAV